MIGRPRTTHSCDMSRTALAAGAKVAAPTCDDNAPDGSLAARARFTGFLINSQMLMEIARPTLDINIIAKSSSLKIDCALENFLHRVVKAACGGGRYVRRLGEGMNAGFKQRFVRINVSQA